MTSLKIREIESSDINYLREIGINEEEFSASEQSRFWSETTLIKWIDSGEDVLLIAEVESKRVGFLLTQFHEPTGMAIISDIFVDKNFRRQGIGKSLIKEAMDKLREKGAKYFCAHIHKGNEASIKLFESVGFSKGFEFNWMESR